MKNNSYKHPKISILAGKLNLPPYAALGIVEAMLQWCRQFAIQGDIGKWPDASIANGILWDRQPSELIEALVSARFVDKAPEPHRLVIHDIKDHADNTWKQNLEDAALTWWDGSSPRSSKYERNSARNGKRATTQTLDLQEEAAGFKKSGSDLQEILNLASRNLELSGSIPPDSFHSQSQSQSLIPPTPKGDVGVIEDLRYREGELRSKLSEMFGRRGTTEWSGKELNKLREVAKRPDSLLELRAIRKYYDFLKNGPPEKDYRRHDIQTLLNNWPGELDRANNRRTSSGSASPRSTQPVSETYKPMEKPKEDLTNAEAHASATKEQIT
jgi:hypothetical protein